MVRLRRFLRDEEELLLLLLLFREDELDEDEADDNDVLKLAPPVGFVTEIIGGFVFMLLLFAAVDDKMDVDEVDGELLLLPLFALRLQSGVADIVAERTFAEKPFKW